MTPRAISNAVLLVLCVGASCLAGCGSTSGPGAKRMSFANMQAINPGVDSEWLLAEYPFARNVNRRPDGSLKSLGYNVDDPQGKSRPVMFHFDTTGTLERKQYGGPVIRPPPPQAVDFGIQGSRTSTTPGRPPPPKSHPYWTPAGYSQSDGTGAGR